MIKTFNQLTQRLEPPLLSIVTVTHNDSEGLLETLESIFTQRRGLNRTQVVVVNASPGGASTQLTNQFLRRRDTVIAEPDKGIYDGMNKGWRSSSGRFVQFLNSGDTFFDNSSLGVITDALTSHPGARWAIGRAMHQFGGAKAPSERLLRTNQGETRTSCEAATPSTTKSAATSMLRLMTANAIGPSSW